MDWVVSFLREHYVVRQEMDNPMTIKIVEEKIGSQYVFTSPDVEGLYVAHEDRATAYADIMPTIRAMDQVRLRLANKALVEHNAPAFG